MRRHRLVLAAIALVFWQSALGAATTFRLYDGITAYIPNPEGRMFTVKLDVRDLNLMETGPREVLVKIYDPQGRTLVRTVIPDDGVTSKAFLPAAGAWDHEAWYYAYCRMQGTEPMLRWSAPSAPDRLAAHPKRTFTYPIQAGPAGVYRVQIVGFPDHYVTLSIDPGLPFGIAGHPTWVHGSPLRDGGKTSRSYLYVPRGTTGLHLAAAEFDGPHTRRFTLTAPDGQKLHDGPIEGGLLVKRINFGKTAPHDDRLLTLDVSAGPNDYLVNVKFLRGKDPEVTQRGDYSAAAVFAPDEKTAQAIQGGAVYHDGRVFWHAFQVRLHDWLKKLPAEEFVVKDAGGKVLELKRGPAGDWQFIGLPTRPGFLNVNGLHWGAPVCDGLMHNDPAHKNPQALNVALRDLAAGLRSIGPGEIPASGPFTNMGYEYSNYAWQYWRPGWRILQQSAAPPEVKAILRDAYLICGDRLAFCVTWARTNGNSFAQVPAALRYCQQATGDPLQKQLFDTYWQRFTTGGWGERAGIGRSGLCQESFGYDHHYGSYMLGTWKAIIADLEDVRFQKVYDRIRTVYSYTLSDEVAACPWSARTEHQPQWDIEKTGPFAWKGLPGPDFTTSVNGGDEWFAARRPGYYALTYHGRISPRWVGAAFAGQIGYGGGVLCQLHIPGKGLVLASTLEGSYGEKMHPSKWRNFHLHSIVGQTTDGQPLVAADSEHDNAKLDGNTVSSSGAVRGSAVQVARTYTFNERDITCTVTLKETGYNDLLNLWIPNPERGKLAECYEMIPFLPSRRGKAGPKKAGNAATVTFLSGGKEEKEGGPCDTIVIDRGGFGVRIELDQPRPVLRGQNNTLLIALITGPTPASKAALRYRIVPFAE